MMGPEVVGNKELEEWSEIINMTSRGAGRDSEEVKPEPDSEVRKTVTLPSIHASVTRTLNSADRGKTGLAGIDSGFEDILAWSNPLGRARVETIGININPNQWPPAVATTPRRIRPGRVLSGEEDSKHRSTGVYCQVGHYKSAVKASSNGIYRSWKTRKKEESNLGVRLNTSKYAVGKTFATRLTVTIEYAPVSSSDGAAALGKGHEWLVNFRRLARVSGGAGMTYVRWLYLGICVPRVFYGAEVWSAPTHQREIGANRKKSEPAERGCQRGVESENITQTPSSSTSAQSASCRGGGPSSNRLEAAPAPAAAPRQCRGRLQGGMTASALACVRVRGFELSRKQEGVSEDPSKESRLQLAAACKEGEDVPSNTEPRSSPASCRLAKSKGIAPVGRHHRCASGARLYRGISARGCGDGIWMEVKSAHRRCNGLPHTPSTACEAEASVVAMAERKNGENGAENGMRIEDGGWGMGDGGWGMGDGGWGMGDGM
ncbi:hypothetical protein DFH09DRAFT_1485926 [Mycena vulgaris]|nr:hypothetical protein DFH09DRAFT_1485926 [Mycena vulgaris]